MTPADLARLTAIEQTTGSAFGLVSSEGAWLCEMVRRLDVKLCDTLERVTAERDEALAKVERLERENSDLRESLHWWVDGHTTITEGPKC